MKTPPVQIAAKLDVFWEPADLPEPVSSSIRLLIITTASAQQPEEDALMKNIVKACQLPETAVQYVFIPDGSRQSWVQMRERYQPDVVLTFGIEMSQMGVAAALPYCHPSRFDDRLWVVAPSLEVLKENRELRHKLWTDALKRIFIQAA